LAWPAAIGGAIAGGLQPRLADEAREDEADQQDRCSGEKHVVERSDEGVDERIAYRRGKLVDLRGAGQERVATAAGWCQPPRKAFGKIVTEPAGQDGTEDRGSTRSTKKPPSRGPATLDRPKTAPK
jgi:hypothetical protein